MLRKGKYDVGRNAAPGTGRRVSRLNGWTAALVVGSLPATAGIARWARARAKEG